MMSIQTTTQHYPYATTPAEAVTTTTTYHHHYSNGYTGYDVPKILAALHAEAAHSGLPVNPDMWAEVASHEEYYASRLLSTMGPDFAGCVYHALEHAVRSLYAPHEVEDYLRYVMCTYPTPREQLHLYLNGHALAAVRSMYDSLATSCCDCCVCYRHYEWAAPYTPAIVASSSGSMTPDAESPREPTPVPEPCYEMPHVGAAEEEVMCYDDAEVAVASDDVVEEHYEVPVEVPVHDVAEDERELEEFLARANLSHLYGPLRSSNLWVDMLRSIPLGLLHAELMHLVPHRAHRQRLIDAMHSTVDLRSSHKEKQGMWLKARDEGRTVYVRGIEGLTDYELRHYLNDLHGEVLDMRYMFDPRNSSFMGYGFVLFRDRSAVDSILRRVSYRVRDGITICVKCSDEIKRHH